MRTIDRLKADIEAIKQEVGKPSLMALSTGNFSSIEPLKALPDLIINALDNLEARIEELECDHDAPF